MAVENALDRGRRLGHSSVRPQDNDVRPRGEELLERACIGVIVENQFSIRGDLGYRARDDVVRLASEQVELPDTSVGDISLESL